MTINTPLLGLPKPEGTDNARDYLKGTITGGGLHAALNILDNAITLTGTATLSNKTLVSPVINGTVTSTGLTLPALTMAGTLTISAGGMAVTGASDFSDYLDVPVITTPGNPGASRLRVYAKSDGLLYRKTSGGTEAPIGGAQTKSLGAEGLSPIDGCDPVLRQNGTSRYELAFVHTVDGHASANLTVPQNYNGGVIRFKGWIWTTAGSQTVWRVYGATIGAGENPDAAWNILGDVTVTASAGQLAAFTVDWPVASSAAGKVLITAVQRLAVSNASDTFNDVAYFRTMDVLFGA